MAKGILIVDYFYAYCASEGTLALIALDKADIQSGLVHVLLRERLHKVSAAFAMDCQLYCTQARDAIEVTCYFDLHYSCASCKYLATASFQSRSGVKPNDTNLLLSSLLFSRRASL